MWGVKESTSCVQEFMGAFRAQAVSRVYGGVKESTSCVQELMGALRRAQAVQEFMGALRRAQAVFKSSWGR